MYNSKKEVYRKYKNMFIDERKSSEMAELLNPFDYIILDTCSLMDENFPEWMDVIENAKEYRKAGQPIIVFQKCEDELKKHVHDKNNDSKRIAAKRALKILRHATWKKLLTISKKEKNQNFADNAIYVRVSNDRITSKIAVITQDNHLAEDLIKLNNLGSQKGYRVCVYKITKGGTLQRNSGLLKNNNENRNNQSKQRNTPKEKIEPKRSYVFNKTVETDSKLKERFLSSSYSKEKRIEDIKYQLKNIAKLSKEEAKEISLVYDSTKLNALLKEYSSKQEDKKDLKKKELIDKPNEKLYFGSGWKVEDALHQVAHHYNLMFRDPSIPFVKGVHGDVDLTLNDFEQISSKIYSLLSKKNKTSFMYSSFEVIAEKANNGFHVYFDFSKAIKDKEKTKRDNLKPKEAPKKIKKKDVPFISKETKMPKKEESASKQEDKLGMAIASPVLVVAIPEEKVKSRIEAKTRNETLATKEIKRGKAPLKKSEVKGKKDNINKKKEPSKVKKASSLKKEKKPISEVIASDKRLRALISNPNYPIKDKISDINSQLNLIKGLSSEEKEKLSLSQSKLKKELSLLEQGNDK